MELHRISIGVQLHMLHMQGSPIRQGTPCMSPAGPHPYELHEHLALQPQVLLHRGALIREWGDADSYLTVASKQHHVAMLEVSRLPCTMRLSMSHAAYY